MNRIKRMRGNGSLIIRCLCIVLQRKAQATFLKVGHQCLFGGELKIHDETNLKLRLLAKMWSATFIKHLFTPI